MSSMPAVLIAAQDIPAAAPGTPPFTADVNGKGAWIDHARLTNHSGVTQTVIVSKVSKAGSIAAFNSVTYSLAAGASQLCAEFVGGFLAPGDFINWSASNAATVGGEMSGRAIA